MNFITKILNTKFIRKDPHGSLHMPVYDSVAFEFDSSEDLALAFEGKKLAHTYSRITNPTIEYFEQQIKAATSSQGVVAVSSGMAAITNLLMTVTQAGDNIITTKHLFGNTYSLLEKTLKPFGLEVKYTDLTNTLEIEKLIDSKTKAVFLETITNPQLEVSDIEAISKVAKDNNILLIADTTITPPYLFNSKKYGVDVEVLSSTKYISGGATSVGGLIIDNGTYNWNKNDNLAADARKYGPFTLVTKLKREVYRNLGASLSPHNAYLQSLGLETLALRADRSCANTLKVAEYLEKHHKVQNINYPGLESSKYFKIAKKQFGHKAGALLTFDLESKDSCFKFMDNLKIIRRTTNLNDNKTLVLHPASTIFCEYTEELKKEMNVRETMIRLAVGIEGIEDLLKDISNALEAVK
ncbi:MAG: O-acetylhomoserine aminocarboxypropyltransferase/cysteine synthase [Bacteroidetes bacterium]|nr:O-acetylhomoserine aminocarboxypropyltransferase/cysteine synthase [Bacteroidota bacterium]